MPPPPKPSTRMTLSKYQASPYFNNPKANKPTSVIAVENDEGRVPILNDEKENILERDKTVNHSIKRPTTDSHGNVTATCQSSSKAVPSQGLASINVEHEKAASSDPIDHDIDTCSLQDDEIPLYLEVGGQQKGFRSAKRFASAIAARKKMKEL